MTPVWDVAPHPVAYDTESPGNWRQHDIQPFKSGVRPPTHTDVPALMRDWVDRVCHLPNDPAPIAEAVAKAHVGFERAILDNLMRFVIPVVADPLRLVPIEALATKEISAEALRVAAYRGRLRAQRGDDRVWRSTKKWVDEYLAERFASLHQPRGPRRRQTVV